MQITVSAIGLAGRDLGFLNSIFRLSPQLQDSCRFVGTEKRRVSGRLANVLFINADDTESVEAWKSLEHENPHTTPIMVTSDSGGGDGLLTLRRPLILRNVLAVLEQVTAPDSHKPLPDDKVHSALSILVVDDSFPIRKYMEEKLQMLSNQPLHLDFASSGEEALLKTQREQHDLVFLDVVMPGIDGYSVCKKIKAGKGSYVVMLTSKKSPFDKVKGALSGSDAYVTKPPPDTRLKELLDAALARFNKDRQQLENTGTAAHA